MYAPTQVLGDDDDDDDDDDDYDDDDDDDGGDDDLATETLRRLNTFDQPPGKSYKPIMMMIMMILMILIISIILMMVGMMLVSPAKTIMVNDPNIAFATTRLDQRPSVRPS